MTKKTHAPPENSAKLDFAMKVMEKSGLRKTKPRQLLLEFLIREHGPFTLDEIHEALKREDFDLVTAYRIVGAFEKIALIRRCDFGDGTARYEFQPDPEHHHHHVICTACRKTETLDDCRLPRLEAEVRKRGYSKVRHSLEFFGVCKQCERQSV